MLLVNKNIGMQLVEFTPAFYKRAYRNYKNGDYREVLALIERAEIDSYIAGCLLARHTGYKRSFAINSWSEDPADEKIRDFVDEVYSNLYARDLFEFIIDARFKKYSVVGLDWDVVNGRQVPVNFQRFDQKYFKFDKDDNNKLKIDFGKNLVEIEPGSAIVTLSHSNPIMLTVLKDYIRKEFGEENWSSFLEIFGEAFIIGKYPRGASDGEKTQVEAGINNIGSSTRGVVPEGTEIQIIESRRSTGDHKDYVQDCKEGISIALLGHKEAAGSDKQMQIGDTTAGIQVKKDVAIDDMYWLEDKNKAFIKMLVDRNFPVSRYPYLVFDKSESIDPSTKLDAARFGLDAGAEIDPQFLIQMGIPILNTDNPLKKAPSVFDFGQ